MIFPNSMSFPMRTIFSFTKELLIKNLSLLIEKIYKDINMLLFEIIITYWSITISISNNTICKPNSLIPTYPIRYHSFAWTYGTGIASMHVRIIIWWSDENFVTNCERIRGILVLNSVYIISILGIHTTHSLG